MKSSQLVCLFLLLSCSLCAQLRLQVEGDAKITGQLNLSSAGSNLLIGTDTGEFMTTGQFNTFIGLGAGAFNQEGESNTFIGLLSGYSNTGGKENTFIGAAAGLSNLTGTLNTFVGMDAGRNSTAGSNTFLGANAGSSNTSGTANVFVGSSAGQNNTNASYNTFVGFPAGLSNLSGQFNTFMGYQAGLSNNTGGTNTFLGAFTATNNTTGSGLVAIGYNASPSLISNGSIDNAFTLGNHSLITASHSGMLGNISMQKIGGYVTWGTASDGRMKTEVREDVHGLDFILHLRPVSYQVDALKLDRFLRQGMEETAGRKEDLSVAEKAQAQERRRTYEGYLREKSAIRYTGFIAQEVERAMSESGFEFSGLVQPAHAKDHYSLRYAEFVVPLVKATQEQQEIIEEQQTKNQAQAQELDKQRREIENLQFELTELRSLVEQLLLQQQKGTQSPTYELNLRQKAMLAQNRPNPFPDHTVIDYFIPGKVQNAVIQVTSADGKILGQVMIRESGKGQVNIQTDTYPAGTYFYSLILDGQLFETKRMLLTE